MCIRDRGIAGMLLEKETLEGDAFRELMEKYRPGRQVATV